MEDYKLITVQRKEENGEKKLIIHNPTDLKLIGEGSQGAVFQLSEDCCVKIYVNPNAALKEGNALDRAKGLNIVPKLYEVGTNYVIMEYLRGPNLKSHLKKMKEITPSITKQIIMIRKELKRIGFTRIKTSIGHFILTDGNILKAIDHSDGLTMNDPHNPKMFLDLKKLGLLEQFLEQAKGIDMESYEEWSKHINFRDL
ncbi:hypothetical protein [Litchfieldia salsa]|uniref:Serine/threonine protein kinase n=1 Tax=Litchfieldia salsa TaxID=930152 RepID=A0A1H0TE87_9BACI|nr:hypothetical protein [Litchfieldia salsa]SDP52373.1 hypothetical protein SAMN05216565_103467 [Litchfieldia salsa]